MSSDQPLESIILNMDAIFFLTHELRNTALLLTRGTLWYKTTILCCHGFLLLTAVFGSHRSALASHQPQCHSCSRRSADTQCQSCCPSSSSKVRPFLRSEWFRRAPEMQLWQLLSGRIALQWNTSMHRKQFSPYKTRQACLFKRFNSIISYQD